MKERELHALADALEPMARAPRFEDFDVPGFCAWLRACADAEPVARIYTDAEMVHRDERWGRVQWIEPESELAEDTLLYTHPAPAAPHHAMLDSHRRLVEQAIQDTEHPSGMSTHDGKARIDASILRRMLAIIDSSPAASQAEPCIGNDPACPCQDGDACHYKDAADGTKAWPVPQAEPKRLRECAQRLVDGARWGLAGALGPSSKAREIPSSAWSDVKSRHLASLRDALAAPQAEPIADSDADYWLRNRQAILDAIERAGFVLMSNASGFWLHPRGATDAQAEPKREPRVKPTHEAADAFWRYWHENGETHKHGYYESTWGAINAALACGWTESAPQPQPVLSGYGDYGAAIPEIERPCTCHPDDNPPVPCARKYALNECRAASEPTEAQRELTPAESDVLDSALRKSVKVVARGLREPTEAQQLSAAPPHEFTQWIRDNMPPNTIIGDPEWWAPRLWQRAIRALAAKE